ncbi:hypothetical protein U0070_025009 [Myodes glareolus]|uniref:Uncharacterized protein n=1 Tax=Myodes glareolus TaxID=447135 RepID=A0AAW0I0K8_MYOGA
MDMKRWNIWRSRKKDMEIEKGQFGKNWEQCERDRNETREGFAAWVAADITMATINCSCNGEYDVEHEDGTVMKKKVEKIHPPQKRNRARGARGAPRRLRLRLRSWVRWAETHANGGGVEGAGRGDFKGGLQFHNLCIISASEIKEKMDVENEQILNINPADPGNLSDSFFSGDEENADTEEIENEINGNWIFASSIHKTRINAKAKRRLRKNSLRDSGRGDSVSDNGSDAIRSGVTVPTSPKGIGIPDLGKKGGCQGKVVQEARVYDVEEVDVRDPNFDDDQENCVYETVVLPLHETALEKTLTYSFRNTLSMETRMKSWKC